MKSYLFGGETGISYDDLKKRQMFAEAMMQRGSSAQPKTPMEGINSASQTILGALLARRMGRKESEAREKATGAFQSILGGGMSPAMSTMGGYTPPSNVPQLDPKNPEAIATDVMSALGKNPTAQSIREGLLARGLPEHVADGFLMNFQDESGLNPSINERNPTVPGSRGGFGLYQLTGPRRRAYEAYAAERGVNPADTNAQLDFLVAELQGPESRAAREIFSTRDPGSAAAAIATHFLRPAEEHLQRRVARYTGGGVQTAQAGGIDPQMLELMSNPYLDEGQRSVLGMLLQQQMQANQPMSEADRLDLEMKRIQLEQARNPQAELRIEELSDGRKYYVDPTGRTPPRPVADGLATPAPDAPTTVKTTRSDGSEVVVQWDGERREWVPLAAPDGAATSLQSPVDLTESQARMTLFSTMQEETQPVLNAMEERYNPANIRDAAARATPLAGNFYQTEEGQQYNAAASAWAEGALRLATGAAATPEEFQRTIRTYFAQPGDTPATIQFKSQMRDMYSRAIEKALGARTVDGTLPTPGEFAETVAPPSDAAAGPDPALAAGMDRLSEMSRNPQVRTGTPPPPEGWTPELWERAWSAMPEEDRRLFLE